MKLEIDCLDFDLPSNLFADNISAMEELTEQLTQLTNKAGTDNRVFHQAYQDITAAIKLNQPLEYALTKPIHVRALGIALLNGYEKSIDITQILLDKINSIVPKPGFLLIEQLHQHFLSEFDRLSQPNLLAQWLRKARKLRKIDKWQDDHLISGDGPQWLASKAIETQLGFDEVIQSLNLENFVDGRFSELAKHHYYVEQLKTIAVNQSHPLLDEVQKEQIYGSQFNQQLLLGHQVLNILIERAPSQGINENWLNTIIAIAGDPRVPQSHQRYRKWWSHIDQSLISKVRGWLSKLDLKFFLEALEDFSKKNQDPDFLRMFPTRKAFLEGLFNAGVITHTRLYLSRQAVKYLKTNYKAEHIPEFAVVSNDNKSIIHVQMGDKHMVEGSHSCYLWLYESLHPDALVFNYRKTNPTYSELTKGLSDHMSRLGYSTLDNIQHNPAGFSWQRRALAGLARMGVSVSAKHVLTPQDYSQYKRLHGAGTWP